MGGANQRKAWARFVEAGGASGAPDARRRARPAFQRETAPERFTGIVLGIDPSLRGTGLAVVEFLPLDRRRLLASMTVRNSVKLGFTDCLGAIHTAVTSMLSQWKPAHVAVEETIYVQNFRTAQILGAARGAALAAAAAAQYPIFEYAPRRIKLAVAGHGAASKEQVMRSVRGLLEAASLLPADEADAAAAALCHGFTWRG